MEYRYLGTTGLEVSSLCLGAMMFGRPGNPDHEESISIIHSAIEAGINFIDTADVYSDGESEEIVGKAIVGKRSELIVGTKVNAAMGPGPNRSGNSRKWIIEECENSLRRLGTDYIDLYQVHRPSPHIDIDETLSALTDLVRQGKVRYLGSSTFPASAIVEAQWTAERRGRERFVCEQPPYSMLVRGVEADVLETCQRHGMGVITWGPLAGGWLSGKWRLGGQDHTSWRESWIPERWDLSRPDTQARFKAADALGALADEAGMSLVHLALAFVLENPAVTSVIVGPRLPQHLEGQLGAINVELDPALLDRIDEIVAPGTNLTWVDAGYQPPMVARAEKRRRSA
jgi:aryl-alcohol dehydrogenase-like predicted oxidoreductase